jgi:small subunit ribosomal protein S1
MEKSITADIKSKPFTSNENFAELLEESLKKESKKVGSLVKGLVVAIEKDSVVVDIGYKAEGRVPLREFTPPDKKPLVGDEVEVFFENAENKFGDAVLSRERAKREAAWAVMENALKNKDQVKGNIFSRVKGGFSVDLNDAIAFLPGSQVDVKVIKDNSYLLGTEQVFHILKMDRKRGNIVVSRRSVLEEGRAEAKKELVSNIEEGQIMEGVVKNITDYGAFVDLGEVDGLLHVTDISWKRISHPSEVLKIGQKNYR